MSQTATKKNITGLLERNVEMAEWIAAIDRDYAYMIVFCSELLPIVKGSVRDDEFREMAVKLSENVCNSTFLQIWDASGLARLRTEEKLRASEK